MTNDNEMILARLQGVPAQGCSLSPEEAADLGDPNVYRANTGSNAIEGIPPKKHITFGDGKVTYLLPRARATPKDTAHD